MASPSKLSRMLWKGKEKASETHFSDLNPLITYRHLLSQNLGVNDPLRVVALCDSDAFYAACEMVRLGTDKDCPLVVLQWESIIAVNYAARKFGISRMDKIKDAKKRCPEFVVVHVATYKEGEREPGYWDNIDSRTHKVSLDYYRRESMKILAMFKDGLPNGEVEKASIDEAFIDFTRPVREIIFQRYPYLSNVPLDTPDGIDSPLPPPPSISWDGLGTPIPINPQEAENLNDDGDPPEDDTRTTWHDVALSIAAELMGKIREDIYVKLGYSTSAGIARNKFLAKLSASYRKPNSQSILRNAAIPNYIKPMAFQKIRFLGGKLGDAIAKEYDVSVVSDLLAISLEEMQDKFGDNAIWVYEVLRGIDRSEVKEKSALNKSMLASKNLPKPITKASEGQHWIRVLAAELALRLNDARQTTPTLWPKTIVLHARQGYETGRSKQAAFPYAREVTVDIIASAGNRLWKELVGAGSIGAPIKVTSVQLAFTGLESAETGQQNIEGFFRSGLGTKRPGEDISNETRLGSGSVKRPSGQGHVKFDADDSGAITAENKNSPSLSFTCTRCGKRLSLPDELGGDAMEVDWRVDALAALRMEHSDFHFAQDLMKEGDADLLPSIVSTSGKKVKKKKRQEGEGIAKFFTRKS